jgi:F-type H+-transporting ATPase subunit epsilon
MRTFAVTLLDGHGAESFGSVARFIAADASGSFGLLAGHARIVSVLRYGLARFIDSAGNWHYLALPGGVLRFADGRLQLSTVRYFLGGDRSKIVEQLASAMARADSDVRTARATLDEIEHSLMRRLIELTGHGLPASHL